MGTEQNYYIAEVEYREGEEEEEEEEEEVSSVKKLFFFPAELKQFYISSHKSVLFQLQLLFYEQSIYQVKLYVYHQQLYHKALSYYHLPPQSICLSLPLPSDPWWYKELNDEHPSVMGINQPQLPHQHFGHHNHKLRFVYKNNDWFICRPNQNKKKTTQRKMRVMKRKNMKRMTHLNQHGSQLQ